MADDDDDDDDRNASDPVAWLVWTLIACVIALMVTGTVYAIHRMATAW